ncbi:MAG: DUF4178 domain-containing protein [Acidobacteriota bacterium]
MSGPGLPPPLPPPPEGAPARTPGFSPGSGRKRPVFEPRLINCPNCAAQLEVKDENSRLAVCGSCGSQLELSPAEIRVLAQANNLTPHEAGFALDLGDSFRYRKARYEVVARLRYDEEESDPTLTYLLYNPRHGSLWLSEYQGHWDVSRTSRVMPEGNPVEKRKGDVVRTYDNRSWLLAGKGVYRLSFVDGALPYIARVGDLVQYAELEAADGSGETYGVQYPTSPRMGAGRAAGLHEMEASRGHAVGHSEMLAATRKKLPAPAEERGSVAGIKSFYSFAWKAALLATFVNFFALILCLSSGREVLDQELPQDGLTGEVLSMPFEVESGGRVLRIDLRAPLQNAWMSIQYAVVKADGAEPLAIHVSDEDLSYYSGREGGESWSEGTRKKSQFVKVDEPGTYRLLVQARSGSGQTSEVSEHPLRVRVISGARRALWSGLTLAFCTGLLFIQVIQYQGWKASDEEDDEDD